MKLAEPNGDGTLVLLPQRIHESISYVGAAFAVVDGRGNSANGSVSSRIIINTLAKHLLQELLIPNFLSDNDDGSIMSPDEEYCLTLLDSAIKDANNKLCQINKLRKTLLGSTIACTMILSDQMYIANVGDSRTYLLRDEKLYQLTNDHSEVGRLVAGGQIEPEDVYTHPQRLQLFRRLGEVRNVQVDMFKQQVHPGDTLLLCSDGLWTMVRDAQITEILNHSADPQKACAQLIEVANANGGEDNVSVVVIFVR
jgi:serine/threonine protein phosphatase PrpC